MPEPGYSEIPNDEINRSNSHQPESANVDREPAQELQFRRVSRRAFAVGAASLAVGTAMGPRRAAAESEVAGSTHLSAAVQEEAAQAEQAHGQNELLPNAENQELIDYLEAARAENLPPVNLFKIHKEYTQAGADPEAMTPPELRLLFELDKEGNVVVRYHYVGLEANNFLFYLKESEDKGQGGRAVVVKANQGEYQLKNDQELQAAFYTDEHGQVHYSGDVIRAVQEDGAGGYISLASSDREAGLGLTGEVHQVTLADLKAQSLGKSMADQVPTTDDKGRKIAIPGRVSEGTKPTQDGFHDPSPLVNPLTVTAATSSVATAALEIAQKRQESGLKRVLRRLYGGKEVKVEHAQLAAPEVKAVEPGQVPVALGRPEPIPALPENVPTPPDTSEQAHSDDQDRTSIENSKAEQ